MDWQALQQTMPRDKDLPQRSFQITALTAILNGRQYDGIAHSFQDELSGAGEYITLSNRRPSVRSNLCRTVVNDSVSLLFSEGHFPRVHSADKTTAEALTAWAKERRLNEVFADAATRGSVGSVALLFKVLRKKPFVSVMNTAFLTPEWDPEDPDGLLNVTERYKVRGRDLTAKGYEVPAAAAADWFWFQRSWDAVEETWFLPLSVTEAAEGKKAVRDGARSLVHGLGFIPVHWIRNLPGGDDVDGGCTFEAAISTAIEVDYQLSSAGRGLKYAADPKLVIRDPSGKDQPLTGGAANAIVLGAPDSDAKFLEINGTAASAVLEHVRYLRAVALESIHGNRADADKISAAQSGRAMELMNQGLIWLADRLRTSYGEGALLAIMRMVCMASAKVQGGIIIDGKQTSGLTADGLLLQWPAWFAPTDADKQSAAGAVSTLVQRGVISEETATRIVAGSYDVEDIAAERARILAERAAADARLAQQPGVQTKVSEALST